MRSNPPLALLLLLSACLLPLSAEPATEQAPHGFRTLGCRITLEDLYYEAADPKPGSSKAPAPRALKVFDSTRSDLYEKGSSTRLIFYRIRQAEDQKILRHVVAEADLRNGGTHPLILFFPDPSEPGRLRTMVLADDATAFPDTTCRFINLTRAPLFAQLAKTKTSVAPSSVEQLATGVGATPETRYTTVTTTGTPPLRIYSNNWVVRPRQRILVLIYAVDGQAEVHRVTDSASG